MLAHVAIVEHRNFELLHPVDRDKLVALVGSWSNVASLAEPERKQILERVRELWNRHPDLNNTSHASLTYRTETYRVSLT